MAGQDADLNLDLGEKPKKSKNKLFIIIGLVVVLLGGGGAAWYFLKAKKPEGGEDAKKEEHDETKSAAVFVPLPENFVVNIRGEGRDRIAQISITLMSHSAEAPKVIEENMPLIKSALVELFSSQKAEELLKAEGKEKLRDEALKRIQGILTEEKSEVKIDKVLFNGIVMQ